MAKSTTTISTTAGLGRPVELPGPLGELARLVGGTIRLAALMGVHPRTVQRWGSGRRVPTSKRLLLQRIAAENGMSATKQKALAELNA